MATMTMDFGAPRFTAPARSSRPAPVRLTARGRLVVRVALVLAVASVAFLVLSIGKGAVVAALQPGSGALRPGHAVIVQPGDTLWTIALREAPTADPRETIGRIRTLNALAPSDTLQAGQELAIPAAQ